MSSHHKSRHSSSQNACGSATEIIDAGKSTGDATRDILCLYVSEGHRTALSHKDAISRFKTKCHSRDTGRSSAQSDHYRLVMASVGNRSHQRIVWPNTPIASGAATFPRVKARAKGTLVGLIPAASSTPAPSPPNLLSAIRINDLFSTQQADFDRSGDRAAR